MTRPPRASSTLHTPSPSHSNLSSLASAPPQLALAAFGALGAPVKNSGGRGFPEHDGTSDSPSKSAEKVARRKGRAARQSSSDQGVEGGGGEGVAHSGPRRASFSLSITPIRPSSSRIDTIDTSTPASLAHQQLEFVTHMQASNSKAHAYVAPHRRSPAVDSSGSYTPDTQYDRSCDFSHDNRYYASPPVGASPTSAMSSAATSPNQSRNLNTSHSATSSPNYTHKRRSSSGSWRYATDLPPVAPPAAIISRGPYEDPPRHSHPVVIPEDQETVSSCSWADEVEEYERSREVNDEAEFNAQSTGSPAAWSRRPSLADGEELEFLVRIGKRKNSSAFVTNSGIDVPSPVWEEHFDEEQLRMPRRSSVARGPAAASSRRASYAEASMLGQQSSVDENVCTGCGAPPVSSFVALIPCDHLVCHQCLNALINAAAHKPPRPMACFFCEAKIQSFLPAWEGVGAAGGGRIGLVEALQESLRNGDGRKFIAEESVDVKLRQGGRRSSTSVKTTTLEGFHDKENVPDAAVEGKGKGKHHRSTSSTATAIGHPSPLSLKSKKSSSVLAAGSLSQAEYASASGSSSSLARPIRAPQPSSGRRSRSNTVSASTSPNTKTSTPTRSPNNHRQAKSRRNSATSNHRPRFGSDETDAVVAAELSSSLALHKQIDKMRSVSGPASSMDSSAEAVIPEPIEWPVVRLDNIPWDITVAEVEDWLPAESLAPVEKCVMAVHILCNRSDGRTLNQCYVEAASVAAARAIVRNRDGKKLRHRPVHATLSSQGELLNTLFPTYEPGFSGMIANKSSMPCPLLMQTELTGLLSLCRLESPHACKVKERPYFNIVSILQKLPWEQTNTWNSIQVIRLFNTSCAAVEILGAVRAAAPDWHEINTIFADAIVACPGFRPQQKAKLIKKTGLHHSRYPDLLPPKSLAPANFHPSAFNFPHPAFGDNYVTVGHAGLVDDGSTNPAALLQFAPSGGIDDPPSASPQRRAPPSAHARLTKTTSTPNLALLPDLPSSSSKSKAGGDASPSSSKKKLSLGPLVSHHRRVSSIAEQLGVDDALVKAVAEQLGITAAGGGGSMRL